MHFAGLGSFHIFLGCLQRITLLLNVVYTSFMEIVCLSFCPSVTLEMAIHITRLCHLLIPATALHCFSTNSEVSFASLSVSD